VSTPDEPTPPPNEAVLLERPDAERRKGERRLTDRRKAQSADGPTRQSDLRNLTHPERDENGRRTRPWMQWPTLLVLGVVAIGLLVIALGRFRAGAVIIAAGALLALFLRLLLEPSQAGWLVNRSRNVDVFCLGVLGVGLAILAFAVPAPS
jgi:hypothetical protein